VDDSRGTINHVGSSGRTSRVRCSNPGVNQGNYSSSRIVGSGEVNCVGCEDVTESGKVIVGWGTNILNTDNIISFQQRLEVRDDFVVPSN
jgi:hypothetical protein